MGFPCGSAGKEPTCNVGDLGLIPGLGRSPGEGKGYPFQYSGLENSTDCIVHGVAMSQTQLINFHCHFSLSDNNRSLSIYMLLLLLLLSRLSHVQFCATPQTAARQAPLSLGFSRQEQWSGLPFPSPVHERKSEVTQSCQTLHNPMDCSPPGSPIHGIFQARVLEWGAIAFSKKEGLHFGIRKQPVYIQVYLETEINVSS